MSPPDTINASLALLRSKTFLYDCHLKGAFGALPLDEIGTARSRGFAPIWSRRS
jgi:hypothetical protein